jgi:hypothetical protein
MLPVKNTAPDISPRDFREPIIPLFQNSIARLRTNRLDAVFPCWGWIARDSTPSEAPAQTPENNPGKQLLHGPPAQRTGLPNSTNISGYIAQKTKSNAPVFNDAS